MTDEESHCALAIIACERNLTVAQNARCRATFHAVLDYFPRTFAPLMRDSGATLEIYRVRRDSIPRVSQSVKERIATSSDLRYALIIPDDDTHDIVAVTPGFGAEAAIRSVLQTVQYQEKP